MLLSQLIFCIIILVVIMVHLDTVYFIGNLSIVICVHHFFFFRAAVGPGSPSNKDTPSTIYCAVRVKSDEFSIAAFFGISKFDFHIQYLVCFFDKGVS